MVPYNRFIIAWLAILFGFLNSAHGWKQHAVESVASASSSSSSDSNRLIAYVTDWALPSSIAWNKLDHVVYAFAVPEQSGQLSQFNENQLKQVVQEAHDNGKTISLSVGGWTGSLYFSSLVRTQDSRESFAKILAQAVSDYNLDGINLDWEYPNSANGVSCNENNPQDTANFLKFIQTLRTEISKDVLITAAVSTAPFNDENQQPSTQLDPEWATALDAFYIMGYDINGIWNPETGPNAPLYSPSGVTGVATTSDDSAVKAWKAAGIPAERIVLGVPFYGRVSKTLQPITASTGPYVKLDQSSQIQGDQYDTKSADPCPNATPSYSGQYEWRSIVEEGIAQNASGWTTYWDSTTETPYAFKSSDDEFLSFDDAHSLRAKANYANENGLGGVMLWSLEMDDSKNTLLEALQAVRKN